MPSSFTSRTWTLVRLQVKASRRAVFGVFIRFATLPYYRLYHFNTIGPINGMAVYASQPAAFRSLHGALVRWRNRKLTELQFISIASAVLAAAVIGSFSWNTVATAYWLASAFWYISIVLSIGGILLSAQQVAVLHTLGPLPMDANSKHAAEAVRRYLPLLLSTVDTGSAEGKEQPTREGELGSSGPRYRPKWKMVFTWQCPIMFMSYSVLSFVFGLTLLVCTPLIRRGPWDPGCNIAVIYLAAFGLAAATFVFCGFYVYRYIDLDYDGKAMEEDQADSSEPVERLESPIHLVTFSEYAPR